jgi:hypothetical protein
MNPIILAAEATEHVSTAPAGDDFLTFAYAMFGVALVITAIATWIVTPKGHHD